MIVETNKNSLLCELAGRVY